jgi:DNA-binding HxlR family transcriptional regulator
MNETPFSQERTPPTAANHAVTATSLDAPCPPQSPECWSRVQQTLELIGNKWAVPLLLTLYGRSTQRFSDLGNALTAISAKELAKQLRLLETAGLVQRRVIPSKPPAVEYALTTLGISLQPIVAQLAGWSAQHGLEVHQNRTRASVLETPEGGYSGLVHRLR